MWRSASWSRSGRAKVRFARFPRFEFWRQFSFREQDRTGDCKMRGSAGAGIVVKWFGMFRKEIFLDFVNEDSAWFRARAISSVRY